MTTIGIKLPLSLVAINGTGGYVSHHIDVHLTPRQGRAYRALYDGLVEQGVRFDGGKPVVSPPDAIRWVLELLATGLDNASTKR
jgi:hypothetical protein